MASTQGLFGGGAAGDEQKQQAQDFISRYQSGHPSEGYSDEEVTQHLQQAASLASPEQLQAAFQQSVANLPENDRAQFNQMLQDRKAGTGMIDIERSGERKATSARHADDSSSGTGLGDILGGLLGGASGTPQQGGGGLGDILGEILGGGSGQSHVQQTQQSGGGLGDILGGILGGQQAATPAPAPAPEQSGGGGLTEIFKSPIGKAVLAGTAAYAMKEILEGRK